MAASIKATRRGVLGLIAGGAATGALAGCAREEAAPATEGVSAETLRCAEPLFSVSYSDAQREQMMVGMEAWVSRAEALRAMDKPNDLAPATVFDPRLPGARFRPQSDALSGMPSGNAALPGDEADIAFAPVWRQAGWLARGEISSAELTEIYLRRIEAHAPALECFIHVAADRARAEAAERDRERAAGRVRGRLHGIPYALKDIIDVEGLPATWGAEVYRDRTGETTATVARRLEAAGAVLLGKTTAGAIAYGDIWFDGVTRNPFNPEEGSSGSSAGSASAVAAGLCAFAIGTETLGSIVSPSHRCGNAGLRPTFGRVPRTGAMALCWSLDKIGPMTRHVADCATVLRAIAGPDSGDAGSFAHGLEMALSRDLSGMRVGYNADWFEQAAEPDRAALEAARSLGVELVPFEVDERPYQALGLILESEAAAAFEHLTLSGLDERLRWQEPQAWPNTWRRARFASAVDLVNADRLRRQVMIDMAARFEDLDAVIGPNFAGAMLLITNYTGHPQLAFRSGFTEEPTRTIFGAPADEDDQTRHRVPHATSLWAPLFEEGNLLALGHAIEGRLEVADTRPDAFA